MSIVCERDKCIAGLKENDRFPDRLIELVASKGIKIALFYGLGGFRRAKIGYFKSPSGYYELYLEAPSNTAIEAASIVGSLIKIDNKYNYHIHVVLGIRRDADRYESYAGHLIEAEVYPVLEIYLVSLSETDPSVLREVLPHRFR
ncbi:MAG: DUF296 domain-containing protein [Sulfolobales archaeon]